MSPLYTALVAIGLAQFAFTAFVGVQVARNEWRRWCGRRRAVAFDRAWEDNARLLGSLR